MTAITNKVTLRVGGILVVKYLKWTRPEISTIFEVGKMINYCGKTGTVRTGRIEALTIETHRRDGQESK